jgi:fluoride exporter
VSLRAGGRFPLGTLAVNVSGSLAAGVVAGAAVSHGASVLLGAGFIGSYSTFSTWIYETLLLAEDGRGRAAAVNVAAQAAQAALGLAAAGAGWAIGAAL